ncbi:BON domain-containing protein [Paraburkholderia sp. J11-2]|uniref:BON domain-containing protein n=1 Tax=Paraburkholderia sp. J11-2 TaxID=2805431 RepID=UPI002AB72636|nr:BON domain-containing protein [Paraburkholderia sp. J11-2]
MYSIRWRLSGNLGNLAKGRRMKTNSQCQIVRTLVFAAIASCAGYAYAQTAASAPGETSAQEGAPAPSGRSDSALVRDVRRAFTRTTGLNFANIHVTAHHGVVSLTGSVPHEVQIARAGDAAGSVSGVTSVSNHLTVRTARSSGP